MFHRCGRKKAVGDQYGPDIVAISLLWTVQGANIHTFRSYTRGRKGEIDTITSGCTVRVVNLGGSKKGGTRLTCTA